MKGSVWEFWIFGTVAAFIGIMLFFVFTPFINQLSSTAGVAGNFTATGINTSFHNTIQYQQNLWNLWPIGMVGIVFIMYFVFAGDEEELERGRF